MQNETNTSTLKKFTCTAGPRQTSDVKKALNKLLNAGKGTLVLSNYGESVQWTMCSETPEEATHHEKRNAAFNALHEKHEGLITAKNCRDIIADALAAIPALLDCQPTRDERQTPEQVAAETATRAAANVERETKHAEEKARRWAAEELLKLDPEFQHLERVAGSTKSGHALAASNIRRDLKKAFPGAAFSVTSDCFSGGDSVGIRWTDGPTTAEVEALSDKYQEGDFDSMEDIYNYNQSAFCDVYGGAKYVQTSRSISPELREKVKADYAAGHAPGNIEGWELERWIERETNVLLSKASMYNRGAYRGIIDLREGEPYPRGVDFALDFEPLPTVPATDKDRQTTLSGGAVTIEEHTHTKHGFQFWLVVLSDRIERAEFDALKSTATTAGGWYSRQWGSTPGGFAFKVKADAETFAALLAFIEPPEPEPETQKEKLFNVLSISKETGERTKVNASPMTHGEACAFKSKMNEHAHRTIELEEAEPAPARSPNPDGTPYASGYYPALAAKAARLRAIEDDEITPEDSALANVVGIAQTFCRGLIL